MGTEGTKSPPGTGREGATAGTDPPPAVVVPPVAGGEVGRGEVDSRPVAGSGGVAPTDAVDEAPSGSSATCGEERTGQQSVTSPGSDGAEGRGEATVSAGVEAVPDPTAGFPVISVVGAGSSPASSSALPCCRRFAGFECHVWHRRPRNLRGVDEVDRCHARSGAPAPGEPDGPLTTTAGSPQGRAGPGRQGVCREHSCPGAGGCRPEGRASRPEPGEGNGCGEVCRRGEASRGGGSEVPGQVLRP